MSFQTHVDSLGLIVDSSLEILRLIAIDKLRLHSQTWKEHFQLVVSASVQIRCRKDIISSMRKSGYSNELGSLTRCCCQCRNTSFERGDSLLENSNSRISNAAVYVSELLQAEQSCAVCRVIEDI